jgi:hypothetical protein
MAAAKNITDPKAKVVFTKPPVASGPYVRGFPAGSGSGGALFAETPNELGADRNSLNFRVEVKLQSRRCAAIYIREHY